MSSDEFLEENESHAGPASDGLLPESPIWFRIEDQKSAHTQLSPDRRREGYCQSVSSVPVDTP